jgi:hypothetical protein
MRALVKSLALMAVVSIFMLPSDASAKRKRSKTPAEMTSKTMSKRERCCDEIGAHWRSNLNTCQMHGTGGPDRPGGSSREQIYDACIAKK